MTTQWKAKETRRLAKDLLEDRNALYTSLLGMVESYDMLMNMPLPPTMADVIRSVFVFEIARAREALKRETRRQPDDAEDRG